MPRPTEYELDLPPTEAEVAEGRRSGQAPAHGVEPKACSATFVLVCLCLKKQICHSRTASLKDWKGGGQREMN